MSGQANKPAFHGFLFLLLILVALVIPSNEEIQPEYVWLLVLVAMSGMFLVLGQWISGRPLGILISERNLMSLSRFQTVLWTLLLLSAYWTITLIRVWAPDVDDPLAISMDPTLWALMGISTTSLVGSPLISSTKAAKEPADDKAAERTATTFGEDKNEVERNREGTLYGNSDISDAQFTDLFEGQELKDASHIDLARVQMFFFTIVAALTYGAAIFKSLVDVSPECLKELPTVSQGLLALLGISHVGYLGSKSVSRTRVKEGP